MLDSSRTVPNVVLEVSRTAPEWLAAEGYDPAFRARPMARVIKEHVKKPLAEAMLFGKLQNGGTAKVERKGEGLGITAKAK